MEKTFDLNNSDEMEEINALLESAGVHIDAQNAKVSLDTARWNALKTRGAGRPYAVLKENGFLAHITRGEVKQRMEKETAAEIAADLGISRRTLFRRLSECESDEDELL